MKELINIVNSKFQAIIDELKNQKTTLEEKLKRVAEDIDKKVIIASKYKEDVEKSNNIISDLEIKTWLLTIEVDWSTGKSGETVLILIFLIEI